MVMIKEINQNPERYSKKGDRYQISATSSITPLDLPFGEMPEEEMLPVLAVDGIIVKVGEYKLISQTTLDTIRESNNPHYDIKGNGEVKGQPIGQTIPTITLNVTDLISVSKERDILNRIGGVTEVDYVYEGEVITDTNLSQALVEQINYTLTQDINRPLDKYTLAQLELSDESNYDITGLKVVTSQNIETNIFDFTKLTEFLKGVKERMKALNKDFNLIKDIHFKGMIPNGVANYTITKRATSEDEQEDGDFNIVYKTSELASVEKTPTQQLQEQQAAAIKELETTIEQNAAIQAQQLSGAQAADSRTQQYIQQQLEATKGQLESIQKSLQK